MAITVQTIASGRKLGKLVRVLLTPWDSESVEGTNPSFDLKNIVADTVSIDEADPTINDIECETKDEPVFQIPTLGDVTIALNSGEIPNELLEKVFAYTIDDDGNAYRPSSYKYSYAKLQFVFDSSNDIIEVPKVLVTAKITGTSLSSNMVVGAITGTAYSKEYTVTKDAGSVTVTSPYAIIKDGKLDL